MNVALLEKTKASILKGPFDMGLWRMCIASHVVLAHTGTRPEIDYDGVGRRAAKYLGITSEEAVQLFYLIGWPKKFSSDFTCWTDKENAIKRIDWFIKTNGTDKLPVKKKLIELARAA